MKAQYEVLGNYQKEMSVPPGTIETFGPWSLAWWLTRRQPSIVPSGTGRFF